MSGTWEDAIRRYAGELDLSVDSLHYDPTYGWVLLLEDGREIEAQSTAGLQRRLERAAAAGKEGRA